MADNNFNKDNVVKLIKWAEKNKIYMSKDPLELFNQKKLDLKMKGITRLPAELGSLTNLTELDLSFNKLDSLPKEIMSLSNLEVLKLGRNEFENFPSIIVNFRKLLYLDLESNKLKSIPAEINILANLKVFNLFYNKLESIPESIGNLVDLEELNLSANKLTQLPKEIGSLLKLRELNIWQNQITEIPEEIKQLPNLQDLDLVLSPAKLNQKLIESVIKDNVKLAATLLEHGADVNFKWDSQSSNYNLTTPLFEAKSVDMIELLLKYKADINVKREKSKTVSVKVWEDERGQKEDETFLTKKHSLEITKYLKSIKLIK